MVINEEKLGQAIDIGLNKLIEIMKADAPGKDQLIQARLASSLVSTGARYLATQNSGLSLKMRLATMVLKDTKERKKYLAISVPELKLLK